MYLKTLTVKGFKSFASATTLHLEPGVTCVVGPNGSGKSNVVDALAWVMGEQGAKTLRGAKMEDVVFAGTAGRPPLGRAHVAVTIDNADGALPVEYAEVTIARTMFRNGGSEYAINGAPCRLLDVQELLADSGIGREMHVIVGQGQLDAILQASPEERRGFVEEAAGVLKHRRRKEKALRKLAATQANLDRLADLTTELRRQLAPLGRQAEAARRAAAVQAEARDARARLLADDLVAARAALHQELADEDDARRLRDGAARALEAARAQEALVEAALAGSEPARARAQETWFALASLRERLAGTAAVAAERARGLAEEPAHRPSRDPDDLDRQAAAARAEQAGAERALRADADAVDAASAARAAAEAALAAEESRAAAAARAAADRREGLARLAGQAAAARSRLEARSAEIDRLAAQVAAARGRAGAAQEELAALEGRLVGLHDGEADLDRAHEDAVAALAAADADVDGLAARLAAADAAAAAARARLDALQLGLASDGGPGALLAEPRPDGVLGEAAAALGVRPGYESAVAAALGPVADGVVVAGLDAAVSALRHLRGQSAGRAGLLVAGAPAPRDGAAGSPPAGATWMLDVVDPYAPAAAAVRGLLAGVVVVADLAAARDAVAARPDLVAVTRAGDVLAAGHARGGSGGSASQLEVRAAADAARADADALARRRPGLADGLARARAERAAAAGRAAGALARLHESDAALGAAAERLGQLAAAVRAAGAEADRAQAAAAAAERSRADDGRAAAELDARLADARSAPDAPPDDPGARARLAAAAVAARRDETDARLALRTREERLRAAAARAEQLARAARTERAAQAAAADRAARRARRAAVASAVHDGLRRVVPALDASLSAAAARRDGAEAARAGAEARLRDLRADARRLAGELDALTDAVHRDEVARAEQRLRIEALEARCAEEAGTDPDTLVAEYGPHRPVPAAGAGEDAGAPPEADARPYDRAGQEQRLRAAERALARLGRVNPLALEEYAALEERHRFLVEQLDDLRRSRADLLAIVREVDARVRQVFADAYADVEREFEAVFARLFPGGHGRLVLTDPADMLATGVDVEARPPGKKIKRLQLLSGGERSLTAVAFLVALFRARPSPFYVLDEVEAALDDVNLGRLLEVLDELRSTSQLLVVTHQKRTMEIADALYGVSMRGDGVSQVVSQRLREPRAEAS